MLLQRGSFWRFVVCSSALLSAGASSQAADSFYEVELSRLRIVEGSLPTAPAANNWRNWSRRQLIQPYAVLDGEGEVVLGSAIGQPGNFGAPPAARTVPKQNAERPVNQLAVAVRAPEGQKVQGRLYLPNSQGDGLDQVRFEIGSDQASPEARRNFYLARAEHFQRLASRNTPGSAWFRFQVLESRRILDHKESLQDVLTPDPQNRPERRTDYEDTFQVFSGGRAISENLQLDRLIRPSTPAAATVKIDSLEGITVAEMEWNDLIKDARPELDPLSALIPADQHAVFLPSFKALLTLMDEAAADGAPILQFLQQRAEDQGSRQRYERQLCLSADAMSRLLGDKFIRSVAFTGSDPYLRTGTDVAVLFESRNPALLSEFLATKQTAAARATPKCEEVKGEIHGVSYAGAVAPGRAICSYRAVLGNAVVVTNSLAQLERLILSSQGKQTTLAGLPEYKFFRHRYQRSDSDETGFLVVTDATIRRWCGPKWRIATSRRTRAAAILMQLQSEHLDALVAGTVQPQALPSLFHVQELGGIDLKATGVVSSTYGSIEFQTPISELDLTMVTPAEAESYERWRNTYQQYWRQFFDPIAVRFTVQKERLAADVTVMPLIERSDYRQYMQLAGNAKIAPDAADRHAGALFHWAMAIDTKSETMQRADNLLQAMVTKAAGPLSWLGESIAVYADSDPFWLDLAKTEEKDRNDFFEKNVHRLPVAFRAEVSNSLKLAAFLVALRTFSEQAAPNLLDWETKRHGEISYVAIRPTQNGRRQVGLAENFALYYAPTGRSLVVTLNEELLKRAIDRETARDKAEAEEKPAPDTGKPWLGSSLALQIDHKMMELIAHAGAREYQTAMQSRAWANLPILNEWKRRYPKEDPVALHARLWQSRLTCPGGGKYVWNDEFRTMESTVYGHPGAPRTGPAMPAALKGISFANFGVTFEDDGLRAKMELARPAQEEKVSDRN